LRRIERCGRRGRSRRCCSYRAMDQRMDE
jgi:hypothetical protein